MLPSGLRSRLAGELAGIHRLVGALIGVACRSCRGCDRAASAYWSRVQARVRRLRAGSVEVEFDQELAEVREELSRSPELAATEPHMLSASLSEELARLTEVSPRSAVLEAFARIEARLVALLNSADVESYRAVGGRALARQARDQKLISDETLTVVEGLAVLHNLAAHSPTDEIGAERARDYLALADAVLFARRARPGSRAG